MMISQELLLHNFSTSNPLLVLQMRLVLDALKEWVSSSPNKKVWTFLNDKADPVDDYTYQVTVIEVGLSKI